MRVGKGKALLDLTVEEPSPMRVAIIGRFPPSQPGSARANAALTKALEDLGHTGVGVFRLVKPGDHPATSHSVVMEVDPTSAISAHLAALRSSEYDAVIVHYESVFETEIIHDLVFEITAPIVLVLHDLPDSLDDPFPRLLEMASTVIVPSQAASNTISRLRAGPRPTLIRPGSSWVPTHHREGPRRKILTWGFLEPGMGIENVIRALPYLSDLEPPVEYDVIGPTHPDISGTPDSSYREWLRSLASDLEVADQVHFDPLLYPEPTLRARLADADVIVVPYDTTDRTTSRLLTEALSLGRPVVSSRFPYATELLSEGAGTTVEPGDPDALAAAVRRFLVDNNRYRDAAVAASQLSSHLNWNRVAFQFEGVITAATASTREPA